MCRELVDGSDRRNIECSPPTLIISATIHLALVPALVQPQRGVIDLT
jgi:hypothetical protein